jgi:hypothetical protein
MARNLRVVSNIQKRKLNVLAFARMGLKVVEPPTPSPMGDSKASLQRYKYPD